MTITKQTSNLICENLTLFFIGGISYYAIEMLWRGHSHISMFILGGICFLIIGLINEFLSWNMGILWQSIIGATIITVLEFFTGLIVNIWLKLSVWDYSGLPCNLMGQICLAFYLLWIPLSSAAIILDDYLRYHLFKEKKPHYKLI